MVRILSLVMERHKMIGLTEWCVTSGSGGYTGYSATHRFTPYNTWILNRPMYYCSCGKKIKPEEYIEYSKYLITRKKALDTYIRNLK